MKLLFSLFVFALLATSVVAIEDILEEGQTTTYDEGGKSYQFTVLIIMSETQQAKFLINGVLTSYLSQGDSITLGDGAVLTILEYDFAGYDKVRFSLLAPQDSSSDSQNTVPAAEEPQESIPPPSDTTPPSISLSVENVTAVTAIIQVTTDEEANCRYGESLDSFSKLALFESTDGYVHRTVLSELLPDTEYKFYVRCKDDADNGGKESIEFTTLPKEAEATDTKASENPETIEQITEPINEIQREFVIEEPAVESADNPSNTSNDSVEPALNETVVDTAVIANDNSEPSPNIFKRFFSWVARLFG